MTWLICLSSDQFFLINFLSQVLKTLNIHHQISLNFNQVILLWGIHSHFCYIEFFMLIYSSYSSKHLCNCETLYFYLSFSTIQGQPSDAPVVDTAEQVYISSLALLKVIYLRISFSIETINETISTISSFSTIQVTVHMRSIMLLHTAYNYVDLLKCKVRANCKWLLWPQPSIKFTVVWNVFLAGSVPQLEKSQEISINCTKFPVCSLLNVKFIRLMKQISHNYLHTVKFSWVRSIWIGEFYPK